MIFAKDAFFLSSSAQVFRMCIYTMWKGRIMLEKTTCVHYAVKFELHIYAARCVSPILAFASGFSKH